MIGKTSAAKFMMQSSSSDESVRYYDIQVLNMFDPDLKLIHTKFVIKNKLKYLLGELKMLNTQNILVLEYKKIVIISQCIKCFI